MEKILKQIDISDLVNCWEWKGVTKVNGYGRAVINGKNTLVHRYIYEYFYGVIPDNMKVLHKCDNPACCNPSHLFLGTLKDNQQDCVKKGRANRTGIKLNNLQYEYICLLKNDGMNAHDIASLFGVTTVAVYYIINHYSHLIVNNKK